MNALTTSDSSSSMTPENVPNENSSSTPPSVASSSLTDSSSSGSSDNETSDVMKRLKFLYSQLLAELTNCLSTNEKNVSFLKIRLFDLF